MEPWFWFTLVSALFTGFQVFMYKVIAERSYDVALINMYAAAFSAVLLFAVASFFGEGYYLSAYVVSLAAVVALLFMIANITRNNSLQAIDTAIFFPLYKVFGPLFVIVGGLLFFSERFTSTEWLGLVLSLLVPLLLISKAEHSRQKNLWRGLIFLGFTIVLTVCTALLSKEMASATENFWFMLAIGDTFLAIIATMLFIIKRPEHSSSLWFRLKTHTDMSLMKIAVLLGFMQAFAYAFLMYGYLGGPIGIVYTIHSLYILIPIVLSIIYYHEHWNIRKVMAIVLSIAALALLK